MGHADVPRRQTRQLAVVFTDLKGSVRERESLGPIGHALVEERRWNIAHEHENRFGGTFVKTGGDGGIWTFDASSHAVAWALAVQKDFYHAKQPLLRIGIDEGEVTEEHVESGGRDVDGSAVDRASRIHRKAEGGHILVSERVKFDAKRVLADTEARWQSQGPVFLEGFVEPTTLFECYNSMLTPPQSVVGGETIRLHRPTLFDEGSAPIHDVESDFLWGEEFTLSFWCNVNEDLRRPDDPHYVFAYHDPSKDTSDDAGNPKPANLFGLYAWGAKDGPEFVLWMNGSDASKYGWERRRKDNLPEGWHYFAVRKRGSEELWFDWDQHPERLYPAPEIWPEKPDSPPALRIGSWPPGTNRWSFARTKLFRFRVIPHWLSHDDILADWRAGREALQQMGETVPDD